MGAPAMIKIERIIWSALLATIFIYIGVAYMIAQRNAAQPFSESLRHQMVLPLYAIGAVTAVIAFFMRARFRERGAPSRLYNIITWALLEATTIYGLVLAIIAFDWRLLIPPAMVTILGFVVTFPREEPL
jgi:FtsH-binding integral membrane protein